MLECGQGHLYTSLRIYLHNTSPDALHLLPLNSPRLAGPKVVSIRGGYLSSLIWLLTITRDILLLISGIVVSGSIESPFPLHHPSATNMVRLREIPRTATFAWSPGSASPLIATGTRAGAVDVDFSNATCLELWDLGLDRTDAGEELQPVAKIDTDSGCVTTSNSMDRAEPVLLLTTSFPTALTTLRGQNSMKPSAESSPGLWRTGRWICGMQISCSVARGMFHCTSESRSH